MGLLSPIVHQKISAYNANTQYLLMATGFGEGSSSDSREKFVHQVFLSFRGKDVRKTFISHLHQALKQKCINTFYDDSGLLRGEDIQSELYEAIETSKICLVTFSPGYATSRWCLDELVRIMECKRSHGLIVLPVFFGVDPTHLRKQSGPYQKAFDKHENDYKDELYRVNKWRQTLELAADLAGFCLHNKANGYEALLIEHIITEVVTKLEARQLSIPKRMVGAESLVEKISSWLQNGSSEIEVGVMYGLGGVGKTTIAKAVYNRHQFKFSSFLADIRTKKGQNLIHLQEQLIFNISGNEAPRIFNVHEGKQMIRRAIGSKKALVVLDDVDDVEQIEEMFNCPEWFFPGSKIIITTRDKNLLNAVDATTILFEICPLNVEESLELFRYHAFSQSIAEDDFKKISKLFVKYCDGLPLALEVLASSLPKKKTLDEWELHYAKLKDCPNKNVHNVLKLSFDSLNDSNDKDIFLHIAFFMIGMKTDSALTILEGCDLHGRVGLENLMDKCLVSVDKLRGTLGMHHLIQQMAYEIVRQEAPGELGRRSRLIGQKDTSQVLRKKTGTSAVKGLHLDFPSLNASKLIETSAFKKMKNLDILLLENVLIDGDFEDLPKMIKWIFWRGFPLQSLPPDLELDELVVLDMRTSCLVYAWQGSKDLGALKILDLSYSACLVCTPDLSRALMLECLFLKGCRNLIEVHESIGKLTNLSHLNIEGCGSLAKIHSSFGNLENLSILNLKGCKSLVSCRLPVSVVELNLSECGSLFVAGNQLESSVLGFNDSNTDLSIISSVPDCPAPSAYSYTTFNFNLPCLTDLKLVGCGISRDDVFELLSCAPSLKFLNLRDNPISVLSNTHMHPFLKLDKLSLRGCTKLQSISQLPRMCELNTELCSSLRRISYIYDPKLTPCSVYAAECAELVEVDYGCNDRLVLKLTDDMYEGHANQLGFPDFHNFVFGSVLVNSEGNSDAIKRGLYRAGTYQAYRLGDHLATWFDTVITDSELHYTVPSCQLCIQTLNIGFVGSGDNRDLSIHHIKIRNLTRGWEWTMDTPSGAWLDRDNCEVTLTWLSHWCVMKHREIHPSDRLHVSAGSSGFFWIEKWGIRIIYNVQHADEGSIKVHVDGDTRKTGDPCSGSTQRQNMNLSGENSPLIDDAGEEEEKVDGYAHPSPLDLSIYVSERQLDDDKVQDHKLREYHIPYHLIRL